MYKNRTSSLELDMRELEYDQENGSRRLGSRRIRGAEETGA